MKFHSLRSTHDCKPQHRTKKKGEISFYTHTLPTPHMRREFFILHSLTNFFVLSSYPDCRTYVDLTVRIIKTLFVHAYLQLLNDNRIDVLIINSFDNGILNKQTGTFQKHVGYQTYRIKLPITKYLVV